jgi:hypothetical protein
MSATIPHSKNAEVPNSSAFHRTLLCLSLTDRNSPYNWYDTFKYERPHSFSSERSHLRPRQYLEQRVKITKSGAETPLLASSSPKYWRIQREMSRKASSSSSKIQAKTTSISPDGRFVTPPKPENFRFRRGQPSPPARSWSSFVPNLLLRMNNTAETVTLEDSCDAARDSVSWKTARENINSRPRRHAVAQTPIPHTRRDQSFRQRPVDENQDSKTRLRRHSPLLLDQSHRLDRDPIKVTWNFGDGHRSYIKETSHTFTKKGRYTVTLTATDGIADTEKTFRVEIKKYEAPKVRVTSLVPNPRRKRHEKRIPRYRKSLQKRSELERLENRDQIQTNDQEIRQSHHHTKTSSSNPAPQKNSREIRRLHSR